MANVFISHRGADTADAERLAVPIRKAGHVVRLDVWEVSVGDSIVAWMNEGLHGATYLVLCYSDAGIETGWISREWLSALARQMNNEGIRILPVRLTGGKPPAILADIRYADLVKDWDQGVSELLRAIQ